jgi:hypothetical protein
MVFCCGSIETLTPEERVAGDNKNGSDDFPGQRRQYIPTNGNALIAGTAPTHLGHEGEDLVTGKS